MLNQLKSFKQLISSKLTNEGEQALIRVIFLCFIELYLVKSGSKLGVLACGLYIIYSIAYMMIIIKYPKFNEKRQWLALLVDIGMASFGTYITGSAGGIFIGLFLWLIIGYGLRYGEKYTRVAFILTLVGYSLSMRYNPYWIAHPDIVKGFLLTLILVPIHTILLQRKLEKALIQAQSANEAKSKFLSHMSHEIRTPLNGIVGATDLLANTKLNGEQRNLTYHIKNSSILLRQLVNDVLDISKIEQGKIELHMAEFNLKELVSDIELSFKMQAEEKNLAFNCTVEPNCHKHLLGDALYIKQILLNLVGNAIKFTNKGSVDLLIKQIQDEANTVTLLISVKDTGIGINKNKLAQIFDSFTQADSNIVNSFGGSGLGTTIAKNLIELMNGKINVQSEIGLGSEFTVELKLEKQDSTHIAEAKPASMSNVVSFKEHAQRNKKLKVLIADDNATNRYILNAILTQAGYAVQEAEDGDKTLDLLEDQHFDLMLLDLNMPKLDGLEIVDIYKRLTPKPWIPSIIITADATLETKDKCLKAGVNGVLTKPYDTAKLLETIKALIINPTENQTDILVVEEESTFLSDAIISSSQFQQLKSIINDPKIMTNIIYGFVGDTSEALNSLMKAYDSKNYQQVYDLAHTMAGNASNLGAEHFYLTCEKITNLKAAETSKLLPALIKQAEQSWMMTKVQMLGQVDQPKAI